MFVCVFYFRMQIYPIEMARRFQRLALSLDSLGNSFNGQDAFGLSRCPTAVLIWDATRVERRTLHLQLHLLRRYDGPSWHPPQSHLLRRYLEV